MWKTFEILGFKIIAKVFPDGACNGITQHISKMDITWLGKNVLHYDRGWDTWNQFLLPQHLLDQILHALERMI